MRYRHQNRVYLLSSTKLQHTKLQVFKEANSGPTTRRHNTSRCRLGTGGNIDASHLLRESGHLNLLIHSPISRNCLTKKNHRHGRRRSRDLGVKIWISLFSGTFDVRAPSKSIGLHYSRSPYVPIASSYYILYYD